MNLATNGTGHIKAVRVDLREIDVRLRPASQMRVGLSEEAIDAYAGAIDHMPPVKLVYDRQAKTHWLVDGCHTIAAARRNGLDEIPAQITEGSYLDAFQAACRANDTHGVRVTNADKRRRVEEALKHPEMVKWSSRRLAEVCGVVPDTICRLRPEPELSESDSSKRVGRDGKSRSAPKVKPKEEKSATGPNEHRQPLSGRVGVFHEGVTLDPGLAGSELEQEEDEPDDLDPDPEDFHRSPSIQPVVRRPNPPVLVTRHGQPAFPPEEGERRPFGPFQDGYCDVTEFFRWVQNLGGIEGATQGWDADERTDMAAKLQRLVDTYFSLVPQWIAYLRRPN